MCCERLPKPSKTIHTGLGIAAIVLWSATVAFGRSLTEQLGTLTSACMIYLLGGVAGCGYQIVTRRIGRVIRSASPRYLLGCGSLFLLYMVCLYSALGLADSRSQALQVGLLNYLWPMLTLVLSIPILQTKAKVLLVPGVILAMTGVALAMMQDQPLAWRSFLDNLVQNGVPYLLGIMAAVSWALYSTLSRKWAGGEQGGAVPIFMLVTGVVLGGARLFLPERTLWTGRAAFELVFLAVGSNLAYVFWDSAMRNGDIVLVASCSYFTPLLSTFVSSLYLGIVAGVKLWIGCAFVIAGAIVCKLAVSERSVGEG